MHRKLAIATWGLGLAGLLTFAAPAARADFFSYSSTVEITSASAPSTGTIFSTVGGGPVASMVNGQSSVTLTARSSDPALPHFNGMVGTDIVPLTLSPVGSTAAAEDFDFNFVMRVTLVDYAGPGLTSVPDGIGSILFTGRLAGPVGNFASSLDLVSFAADPDGPQSITIGNSVYTVSLSGFTPPDLDNVGTLGLHVRLRPVPEPSALALLGIGLAGAGLMARRRMRGHASA